MSKTATEDVIGKEVESEKVIAWRYKWLHLSGFSKRNAELIATTTRVDLHFACRAIQNAKEKKLDEDFVMKLIL